MLLLGFREKDREAERVEIMARFIMFEREYSWLEKKGFGSPLTCAICNELIQNGTEIITVGVKSLKKYIYHAECFDKREVEKQAEKSHILKKLKVTSNFTTNQYRCNTCQKNTRAIVFREKYNDRILGLICPLCGIPIIQHGYGDPIT